jgi:hypothetical protein
MSAYHGDIFFSLFMYIFNKLGIESDIFFLIQPILYAFITIIAFRGIDKRHWLAMYSLFILTSTFLLLYNNVLRQGLALSFLFLSLACMINKEMGKFYLFSLFAVLSHSSAIFFFFAMMLARLNISFKVSLLILFFIPLLPVFFLKSMGLFQILEVSKVAKFYNYGYENQLVYIKCLVLYFFAIFFSFYLEYYRIRNFRFSYLVKVYVYLTAISIMLLPVLLLSSRFLYYASALLPVLFTYLYIFKLNKMPLPVWICILLISSMTFGLQIYNYSSIKDVLGF